MSEASYTYLISYFYNKHRLFGRSIIPGSVERVTLKPIESLKELEEVIRDIPKPPGFVKGVDFMTPMGFTLLKTGDVEIDT